MSGYKPPPAAMLPKSWEQQHMMAISDDMATRRLAALGKMFLKSFEDAGSDDSDDSSEDGDIAVTRDDLWRQLDAENAMEPDSMDSAWPSGESASYVSGSSREDSPNGPEIFEFDSKAVHPQGTGSSRQQHFGDSKGGHNGSRGGIGVVATPATAASDPVSTWTGSRSELSSLQRQVQTYGAAALDKKAKKQFDATELAKLGARADKAQRMPASVGKGLKRKHTHRAERVQEEAVEAGHLSRQAIAKVRRKQKAAGAPKRDAGLGEHGSAFRGGVLRVSGKPPSGKPRAKVKQQRRV